MNDRSAAVTAVASVMVDVGKLRFRLLLGSFYQDAPAVVDGGSSVESGGKVAGFQVNSYR